MVDQTAGRGGEAQSETRVRTRRSLFLVGLSMVVVGFFLPAVLLGALLGVLYLLTGYELEHEQTTPEMEEQLDRNADLSRVTVIVGSSLGSLLMLAGVILVGYAAVRAVRHRLARHVEKANGPVGGG